MYCRHCGENNPDEAVFCRNCGKKLKEDVKKTQVIDTPVANNGNQNYKTSDSGSDNSDWIGCCLCLIGIFILFTIFGAL